MGKDKKTDNRHLKEPAKCPVCGRSAFLTVHHLIPGSRHSNKWFKKKYTKESLKKTFALCVDCHNQLHRLYKEKELGREFNTPESIINDSAMKKFAAFAAKQKGRICSKKRKKRF
ncbi:MAG: HNH endonuclease [Candidatus Goldiibacteriota bacterium]